VQMVLKVPRALWATPESVVLLVFKVQRVMLVPKALKVPRALRVPPDLQEQLEIVVWQGLLVPPDLKDQLVRLVSLVRLEESAMQGTQDPQGLRI